MSDIDLVLLDAATRAVRNRMVRAGNTLRLEQFALAGGRFGQTAVELEAHLPFMLQLQEEITADYRRALHGINVGGRR